MVFGAGSSSGVATMRPRTSAVVSVASGIHSTGPAASAGTTGPTLGANALREWSFNTQSGLDIPYEFLDEFICDQGTANGLALVNFGNALPASHLFTVEATWEE